MVGTGGCSAIGIEFFAGREPGCWVDKGRGRGMVRSGGSVLVRSSGGCE